MSNKKIEGSSQKRAKQPSLKETALPGAAAHQESSRKKDKNRGGDSSDEDGRLGFGDDEPEAPGGYLRVGADVDVGGGVSVGSTKPSKSGRTNKTAGGSSKKNKARSTRKKAGGDTKQAAASKDDAEPTTAEIAKKSKALAKKAAAKQAEDEGEATGTPSNAKPRAGVTAALADDETFDGFYEDPPDLAAHDRAVRGARGKGGIGDVGVHDENHPNTRGAAGAHAGVVGMSF